MVSDQARQRISLDIIIARLRRDVKRDKHRAVKAAVTSFVDSIARALQQTPAVLTREERQALLEPVSELLRRLVNSDQYGDKAESDQIIEILLNLRNETIATKKTEATRGRR